MADSKTTALTAGIPISTDIAPYVSDPSGAPATKKVLIPNLGSLVLLEEHTAAGSASLDFTTRNMNGNSGATFQADFDTYLIEILNLRPATDNVTCSMRVSTNGGVSYDSTANNYRYTYHFKNTAGVDGVVGSNVGTSFEICGNLDSAAAGGVSGSYLLFNPLSATISKYFQGAIGFLHNDTNYYRTDHGSWYVPVTAVNAFQVFMSSGNITTGTIRVYGVRK